MSSENDKIKVIVEDNAEKRFQSVVSDLLPGGVKASTGIMKERLSHIYKDSERFWSEKLEELILNMK